MGNHDEDKEYDDKSKRAMTIGELIVVTFVSQMKPNNNNEEPGS